ncbi:MAG: PAS domain-containing protein [Sphingomonas sp.]|nr:PAS domain-containing protein [Sphingomonas sp.]
MLQLISEGFVLVDGDFRVLAMNAEGERIEGRPASQIIGTTIWESWPDLANSTLGELWRQAMLDQKPVSFEHRYAWPDGRTAWLEMRAFPSRDRLAIFYRDVSGRKATEEELRRTESELIHASRLSAMGAMAATLAHELSQPLAVVSNYLASARRLITALPAAETREARQAIDAAARSNQRATDVLTRRAISSPKGAPKPPRTISSRSSPTFPCWFCPTPNARASKSSFASIATRNGSRPTRCRSSRC